MSRSTLIILIGVAGSGKSTFANAHFLRTEILSSDHFRGLVSDDEADQDATEDAFAALHLVLERRLKRGKLCVLDATNVTPTYRAELVAMAKLYDRQAVAIVFETPEEICIKRAGARLGRVVNAAVIRKQREKLDGQSDEDLLAEGFQMVLRVMPEDRVEIQRDAQAM